MRIFFVFLLLINLLFAAWLYTQPDRQPAEIKPLPAELKTIQLLKKPPTGAAPSLVENTEPATESLPQPEPEPPLAPKRHCYTLGPFDEEAELLEVKNQLSEQVEDLQVRRREEREPHRYWVFIPPQQNRAQAIAMGQALAQKNVKDYYVVLRGDAINALSLGHFKEKPHADRRLRQLQKLGFDVQTEVIYRQYSLFWLDYSVSEDQQGTDELMAPFLVNGVARLDRDCE